MGRERKRMCFEVWFGVRGRSRAKARCMVKVLTRRRVIGDVCGMSGPSQHAYISAALWASP